MHYRSLYVYFVIFQYQYISEFRRRCEFIIHISNDQMDRSFWFPVRVHCAKRNDARDENPKRSAFAAAGEMCKYLMS